MQVRTCALLFSIFGTAEPIVFQFCVWLRTHDLRELHKLGEGRISTCARAHPYSRSQKWLSRLCSNLVYMMPSRPLVHRRLRRLTGLFRLVVMQWAWPHLRCFEIKNFLKRWLNSCAVALWMWTVALWIAGKTLYPGHRCPYPSPAPSPWPTCAKQDANTTTLYVSFGSVLHHSWTWRFLPSELDLDAVLHM